MSTHTREVQLSKVVEDARRPDYPRVVGVDFVAWHLDRDEPVFVTAVLERTAVWYSLRDRDQKKYLATHERLLVDPAEVPIHQPTRESIAAAKGRQRAGATREKRKGEGRAGGRPAA